MTHINYIILNFLRVMISDLRRRAYDEKGEQQMETLQRIEELKNLIEEIKEKENEA